MKPLPEIELPVIGEVFNLVTETAVDGAREAKERIQRAIESAEARTYQMRMQRTFKDCPGFVGGDFPDGEQKKGCVEVEPAKVPEALAWLKKRFAVNQSFRLSGAELVTLEFITRRRGRPMPGQRRAHASFEPPKQYTLDL